MNDGTQFRPVKFEGYPNTFVNTITKFVKYEISDIDRHIDAYEQIQKEKSHPSMIFSMYGVNKRSKSKSQEILVKLEQSLMNVMKKDNIWIIAEGTNMGIHKMISDAVLKYRVIYETEDHLKSKVTLIGMCSWGVIKDKEALLNNQPYKFNDCPESREVVLENKYDYLIFVNDGDKKEYNFEADLRRKLIDHVMNKESKTRCIQILFNGGEVPIKYIRLNLESEIPLLIFENTGRLGNLLVKMLNQLKSDNKGKVKKALKNIPDKNEFDIKIKKYLEDLSEILSIHKHKIVTYDLENSQTNLEDKILRALLTRKPIEKRAAVDFQVLGEMLELAVRYDSFEFAEEHIFPFIKSIKRSRETVFVKDTFNNLFNKLFGEVIKGSKIQFVRLFLEYGLGSSTNEISTLLYKYQSINSLINSEDHNGDFKRINQLICKLSGNILTAKNCHKIGQKKESKHLKFSSITSDEKKTSNQVLKDIFLWAILHGHTQIATVILKRFNDPIGSALIGSIISKQISNHFLVQRSKELSNEFLIASMWFEKIAVNTMEQAFHYDPNRTQTILFRKRKEWNKMHCLQLAISGKLLNFINHKATQFFIIEIWRGEITPSSDSNRTFKAAKHIPGLSMNSIENDIEMQSLRPQEAKNDLEMESLRPQENGNYEQDQKSDQPQRQSLKKYLQSPKFKFYMYVLSYFCFLLIYGYLNLRKLKPFNDFSIKKNRIEIVVYCYVLSFFVDEVMQMIDQDRNGTLHKLKSYLSGLWNIFDVILFLVFAVGFVLRFTLVGDYFIIVRCLYAISLSLFCLRMMQFYFGIRSMGPKVIMIRKMMYDLFFFLTLFLLFIFAYGLLAQTLQDDPDGDFFTIGYNVLYRPYFQTYGELMLDNFSVPSPCNMTCILQHGTIIGGFAIFLLLTNILLVNLLIAIFGYTINQVQIQSDKYYSFVHMQLVSEFYEKTFLPPPFNIPCYIFSVMKMICMKIQKSRDPSRNEYEREESIFLEQDRGKEKRELDRTIEFELICMEHATMKLPPFEIWFTEQNEILKKSIRD